MESYPESTIVLPKDSGGIHADERAGIWNPD
jgi:hypothetical protein